VRPEPQPHDAEEQKRRSHQTASFPEREET
jgi:hypothetical protein